jgi:hypothetical protein
MRDVLHLPFPRLGEKISIPIDAKKGTFLVAVRPNPCPTPSSSTTHARLQSIPTLEDPLSFVRELPLWPLFEALDASNLLLIARVAMSPSGRVVFVSRHPFMVVGHILVLIDLTDEMVGRASLLSLSHISSNDADGEDSFIVPSIPAIFLSTSKFVPPASILLSV